MTSVVGSKQGPLHEYSQLQWQINYAQVVASDETIAAKDAEIEQLTTKISELEASLARALEVDPTSLA